MLAQATGLPAQAITLLGQTTCFMIGAGRLHEAYQLTQHLIRLGSGPASAQLPDRGWPLAFQADILREWNQLDAAHALAEDAIRLCSQTTSFLLLAYLISGYGLLVRICLSRGELDAARSALQQFERIGRKMSQPIYLHFCSLYATVDQVRLWLACGELDRATRWVQDLDLMNQHGNPFAREREEVARVRILLAQKQPALALERLEPVLQRATAGHRWGHVIETRLLQALAYQMHQQKAQALDALSEAVRLAEPEGYIRSFVDEGAPMEVLFYQMRKRERKHGPTPYLYMLLAAFQQEHIRHTRAAEPPTAQRLSASPTAQRLADPLSERELEVLQLLARGASNQEIAQELIIAIDTVKRHVSHIFAKLGANNRIQVARQAQVLGLLDDKL